MSTFSNVRSKLIDGALHFFSKIDGQELLVLDPDSKVVTIPNGATFSAGDIVSGAGSDGRSSLQVARYTFNPSAIAGQRTTGAHGLGVTIPDNALILFAAEEILTTFADGTDDSATIALSVESANDLVTATAVSSGTFWDAVKAKIAVPDFLRAAGVATAIKLTADREITATVAVHNLTAGKLVGWVVYVIGG